MRVAAGEQKNIILDPAVTAEQIEIQEGAEATVHIGANKKLELDAVLSGRGAGLTVIGRIRGIADMRQEVVLRATAAAPDTRIRIDMRAALADTSASFFDGLIRIEEGASNAAGFLSYKALLLSPGSRAKPIPRLEVLTRDVASLGHAATVGRLNEDEIFYLRSRGLSRAQAQEAIVDGFLSS